MQTVSVGCELQIGELRTREPEQAKLACSLKNAALSRVPIVARLHGGNDHRG
jgi:hypothetical protein